MAAAQGKLYALSAYNTQGVSFDTATLYEYAPSTGTWSAKANGIYYGAAMVTGPDDDLYFIGGYVGSTGQYRPDVIRFDPSTNQGTPRAPLPEARYLAQTAVRAGKIYCIGGNVSSQGSNYRTFEYNLATDSWQMVAGLPQAFSINPAFHAAVTLGTRIFSEYNGQLFYFEQGATEWTPAGFSPYNAGLFTDGTSLYSLSSGPAPALRRYNPGDGSWAVIGHSPLALGGGAICLFNGTLYTTNYTFNADELIRLTFSSLKQVFLKQ